MALRFRSSGLILPVAVSAVFLARPIAAPEVQAADKSIYVTVVDEAGKPVTGLAATDFGIREDNVIREVTAAKAATEPLSVVLLADTTSSVGENVRDIRTGALAFAREFLKASPESQIQLSEFQGAATVRVKFTPKLPDLEKAITRLFPQPETASVLLEAMYPEASELLRIAAHGQHIRRFDIPRADFPQGRDGYNEWRRTCREHHAKLLRDIMSRHGYEDRDIEHVAALVKKEQLKKDKESQALENVVDVVFIEHYFDEFYGKYSHYDDAKIIDIIGKTLRKMSPKGHQAALALDLPERTRRLVHAAVEREAKTLAALAKVAVD